MKFPIKKQIYLLFSLCLIFTLSQIVFAGDDIEWRPISEAELKMDKPKVEPGADAEAIFWDVTLDDKRRSKMTYYHYVRVKIFTERGRERFSKFDIPFGKRMKIENVAARVIKPDGTIVTLPESDIFEREIVRTGKIKIKAKSFAVPSIEPGVIVEYQYEEIRKGDSASGETLIFQRDIPMQNVTYRIRPYKGMSITPRFYNMSETRFTKDKKRKGFFIATMKNVPALRAEPYMPPEDEVRHWVYLSTSTLASLFNWSFLNIGVNKYVDKFTKPNKRIKQKAKELTAGISSDEEKLKKLYEFVQKDIKNLSYDNDLTEDQLDKVKMKDADDILKRNIGTSGTIDLLFASLARAVDFDVNLVLSGDRSEQFFNPNKYPSSFIRPCCVAVKVNDEWKFFNPGAPFLPFGKLIWEEENVTAMLVGDGGYIWKSTPLSKPDESLSKRTGKFNLLEDGTLEGEVKIEFNGQQAIARRRSGFRDSQSKREEEFKEEIKRKVSAAEISNLRIENFADTSRSLTYSYNIKIPNYAQKTGKRLFFQPGVFEYGSQSVFSASERKYNIYFPYPWAEQDDIEIQMPEGFSLDSADAPANTADPQKIGSLSFNVGVDKKKNILFYKRKFHFGGGGNIYFTVNNYQPLKNMFDAFNKADTRIISLKKQ